MLLNMHTLTKTLGAHTAGHSKKIMQTYSSKEPDEQYLHYPLYFICFIILAHPRTYTDSHSEE